MTSERDRLVGLIYDGVADDRAWSIALTGLANLVGARGVGLGMQDMKTYAFRSFGSVGISANLNPTYQRLASGNRIWREIARPRQWPIDVMVIPKSRTELYAGWFRPQDFHSVTAHPMLFRNDASAVVVAFRGRRLGDFEPKDLGTLSEFAEHFARAIGIRLDREETGGDLAAAERALNAFGGPILLLDRACHIQYANAPARAMLEASQAIRVQKGRLDVQDPEANMQLTRIAAQGCGGELRRLGSGVNNVTIIIHPRPDGPGGGDVTLVRIVDANRKHEPVTPDRLRRRLSLSPRQAEAVAAPAAGLTGGGGEKSELRRADPPYPCPAGLRAVWLAQPRGAHGAAGPARVLH
jgi:hypothetical protein